MNSVGDQHLKTPLRRFCHFGAVYGFWTYLPIFEKITRIYNNKPTISYTSSNFRHKQHLNGQNPVKQVYKIWCKKCWVILVAPCRSPSSSFSSY